jgi:hypothetical protein
VSSLSGTPAARPRRFMKLDSCVEALADMLEVSMQFSSRAGLWIKVRDGLSLPRQLLGVAHRYAASIEGREVDVLCVGSRPSMRWLRRMFDDVRFVARDRTRAAWNPSRGVESGDLVLARVHPWFVGRFREGGWLILPNWVRFQGELAEIPPKVPCRSLECDLQKLRRQTYTLEMAGSAEDWDEFFFQMLAPHARNRFGEMASIPSAREWRGIVCHARLLFVRRGNERVAGFTAIPKGEMLWSPRLGVRDASLLKEGVVAAGYALLFQWARENGFQRIDLGRTSPFIRDGVYRYKRKWGLAPVADPAVRFTAAAIDPACGTLRQAFARQPVLIDSGAGLRVFSGNLECLSPAASPLVEESLET